MCAYKKNSRLLLDSPQLQWELSDTDKKSPPLSGTKKTVPRPNDAVFLDHDFFVVADTEGHRLLLFHVNGQLVSVIGNKQIWPNCVAVTNDKKIAVTDRKSGLVKLFDVTKGVCVDAFGIDYDEDVVTSRFHGITSNSLGEIIVTDTGMNTVHVFAKDGTIIGQFGTKGTELRQLNLPFYVTVDPFDNMYVSDNMNYCVKVFDRDGIFKQKIGSGRDWGQRQFLCPYGIAVDVMGNVLVSDWESSRVAMYDQEGSLIKYALAKSHGIQNPCGLAASVRGDLVVTESDCDYSNVKLFQMYSKSKNIDENIF